MSSSIITPALLDSNFDSALPSSREALRQSVAGLDKAIRCWEEEMDARLEAMQSELEVARKESDFWHAESIRHQDKKDQLDAALRDEQGRTQHLHDRLSELHGSLHGDNLPLLILEISMALVKAEAAIFVDQTGQYALAAIGVDDKKEEVKRGMFRYTQAALDQQTPVVRNDSQQLPDGTQLVNLAALPVAVKGELRGAILVANKRSGPFTDEDTQLLLSVGQHAGIALENRRLHAQLAEAYLSTIAVMADAIEAKDPYTRGHCEEVATLAVRVAESMGWKGDDLEQMHYAALLHDVGKIGIPDGILLKPGRLLPEEFQIIRRHPAIGRDLVSRVPRLLEVAPLILHHHERFDGAGYPDGLYGEDIPLGSRILGVVDALNAMTTPRPYRSPVSMLEAVEELRRCAGSQFDPQIVSLVATLLSGDVVVDETPASKP